MISRFTRLFQAAACTSLILLAGSMLAASKTTALDRYIAMPDPSYRYQLAKTVPGQGYTMYVLEMTSQTWRSSNDVDRTEWKHWLNIIKPDEVTSSKALLFISGGSNGGPPPSRVDDYIAKTAMGTKSVVAELKMVPNQPLVFNNDGRPRSEDSLIAYTWDKFLRGGDDLWPARLPMTKSAVRAMDTITAFCGSDAGGKVKVDKFVVSGGSKRGWTTWTTAAVDKRVIAIVPFVIDVLNAEPSFRHHLAAYGFYAPAVGDYERMGLMNWNGTKEYRKLMEIEEPYEYRDRLTMPKFIVNSTGDQFFLPDSWRFYFDDLRGVKYLRYVPNTDHSLGGSDASETLMACYAAVINNLPLPQFDWKAQKDGSLLVRSKDKPREVKLWQATNPEARDFRLEKVGKIWTSSPLQPQADGSYIGRVPKPEKGFTAFMVELTYATDKIPVPFKFTTGVEVVPDVLPFAEKANKATAHK